MRYFTFSKKYIFLGIILCLATFLRFYQLGNNPPFLNWDEAAWGYNAYAIGIDGKDEFGRFLPLNYLESFGDFKPPVYAYLAVIPVKIFGLDAFATRMPSAFFGVLTVFATYFLVKRIFWNGKCKDWYALTSAGILAISPWHIMLSRAAFEANIATFFVVVGVWLFLAGVQGKKWYLVWSAIPFALSFYTFNTPRVVTPLLVISLSAIFCKTLFVRKKQIIFAFLLGIILLIPTAKFLFSPQASLRFQEVNIFSNVDVIKHINQEVLNDNGKAFSKIIHNRRIVFGVDFLKHYFDNVSSSFLFITGDGNPKFSIQDAGQMYLWDLPFFIVGIFLLFKKKEGNWWTIPLWLLLGIIPAATARETPHALRTEITLPTFQILVAYGVVQVFLFMQEKIKNFALRQTSMGIIFLLLFLQIAYFLHSYYTYYPYRFSGDWNYTYKTSIAYVAKVQTHYDTISISTALGRPYIYYLFSLHVPPSTFRKEASISRDVFGFVQVNSFGKYVFRQNPSQVKGNKVLYIDDANAEMPKNAHVLQKFANLDGTIVLRAYTL